MLLFYIFIIGLCVGSFLNVLIDRLSNDESILGRSYCDNCKKQLKSIDLIPIFSYFFLKGKCRFCNKKINFRYPIVEVITGILFLIYFIYFPTASLITKVVELALISGLIVVFFADLKYQIIPDQMLILIGILGVFSFLQSSPNSPIIIKRLLDSLIVALPIFILYAFSKGRAMGFGDVKLSFVVGLLFGLWNGLAALYIAFVLGAIISLFLIFFKKKKIKSKIAFGPFIVIGTFCVFFIDKLSLFVIPFFSN